MHPKWYQYGDSKAIVCVNCDETITGADWSDHQSRVCPYCEIGCLFYDMGNRRMVQIVPQYAPEVFQQFLEWTRTELDEIEVMELFCAFEALGISRNLPQKPPSTQDPE